MKSTLITALSFASGLAAADFGHAQWQGGLETKYWVEVETAVVTVTATGGPPSLPEFTAPAPSSTTTPATTYTPPPPPPPGTTSAAASPVIQEVVNASPQASSSSSSSSSSSAPAPSSSSSSSTFTEAILNSTNFFRSEYEAEPLTWNDTLASFAQSWASRCVFAHSGAGYGENIAAAWPTLSAMDGVDMWGDEEANYDWVTATFSDSTGHFTQLVWQGTTSVGCALVSCNNPDTSNGGIDGGDFLVCEYSPAGNVIGAFAQNVRKAGLSKRGVPGLGERSTSAAPQRSKAWSMGVMALALLVGAAMV